MPSHLFVGWPTTLGHDCNESWKFISEACQRWKWLLDIFGTEEEYKISLVSYYILLNFIEYAKSLKANPRIFEQENKDYLNVDIPMNFSLENLTIGEKAVSRISRHPEIFSAIISDWGLSKQLAAEKWPDWIRICNQWLSHARRFYRSGPAHEKLLELLNW